MSGLDVCRTLKADRATAAVPILLISAESSADDIAAGCDDYLAKPFSARTLLGRVHRLVGAPASSDGHPGIIRDTMPHQ